MSLQYAAWIGSDDPDSFFSSPEARSNYKEFLSFLTNRTNSATGVRYRDDPTIFSYNLMNEPRFSDNNTVCQNDTAKCASIMQVRCRRRGEWKAWCAPTPVA